MTEKLYVINRMEQETVDSFLKKENTTYLPEQNLLISKLSSMNPQEMALTLNKVYRTKPVSLPLQSELEEDFFYQLLLNHSEYNIVIQDIMYRHQGDCTEEEYEVYKAIIDQIDEYVRSELTDYQSLLPLFKELKQKDWYMSEMIFIIKVGLVSCHMRLYRSGLIGISLSEMDSHLFKLQVLLQQQVITDFLQKLSPQIPEENTVENQEENVEDEELTEFQQRLLKLLLAQRKADYSFQKDINRRHEDDQTHLIMKLLEQAVTNLTVNTCSMQDIVQQQFLREEQIISKTVMIPKYILVLRHVFFICNILLSEEGVENLTDFQIVVNTELESLLKDAKGDLRIMYSHQTAFLKLLSNATKILTMPTYFMAKELFFSALVIARRFELNWEEIEQEYIQICLK